MDHVISSIGAPPARAEEISAPPQQPTESEIQGVDVLSIEAAVKELWKAGIYAESAMGCTGPVVKVPGGLLERSREVLSKTSYL
jgi:betaine reductase